MQGRCRGDTGEIQGRYRGDIGAADERSASTARAPCGRRGARDDAPPLSPPQVEHEVLRAHEAAQRQQACAAPTARLHLPYSSPTSRLHLAYISPTSPLHLPYISPTSRLHLAYISPTSPHISPDLRMICSMALGGKRPLITIRFEASMEPVVPG